MWEVDIVCISGCSIPVVRVHGVDVDRVQFPAARQEKISREGRFFGAESWRKILFFLLCEEIPYFREKKFLFGRFR